MASSKVSNSVNSDLSLHHHHHHNHNQPSSSPMIADFSPSSPMILRHNSTPTILDTGIMSRQNSSTDRETAEEVWREIVGERRECKFEPPDEMMTLEDFLAKAEEVEVEDDDEFHDYKQTPPSLAAEDRLGSSGLFGFDPLIRSQSESQYLPTSRVVEGGGVGVGGRGKRRGGSILETMDKATQQRQRRMIKNRESAARSRERKQVDSLFIVLVKV